MTRKAGGSLTPRSASAWSSSCSVAPGLGVHHQQGKVVISWCSSVIISSRLCTSTSRGCACQMQADGQSRRLVFVRGHAIDTERLASSCDTAGVAREVTALSLVLTTAAA